VTPSPFIQAIDFETTTSFGSTGGIEARWRCGRRQILPAQRIWAIRLSVRSDAGNATIRRVSRTTGEVKTIAGIAQLYGVVDVSALRPDLEPHRIWAPALSMLAIMPARPSAKIDIKTGLVSTIAGKQ